MELFPARSSFTRQGIAAPSPCSQGPTLAGCQGRREFVSQKEWRAGEVLALTPTYRSKEPVSAGPGPPSIPTRAVLSERTLNS